MKDFYPLPHIDHLVDAISEHEMLSVLDAFLGFYHIRMVPKDVPNTLFITHRVIYAYVMMAFGLLNAEATYQRMINKVFSGQIIRNMEVYVDNMIGKSVQRHDHIEDLEECFRTIRRHNMRLNLTKFTFGLGSDKFLGYLVRQRVIEANLEKMKTVMDMRCLQTLKDV